MASPLRSPSRTSPSDARDEATAPPARVLPSSSTTVSTPTPPPRFGITDVSLILMALIWGVNFSVVKFATGLVAPLAFNTSRVALAAVTLAAIAHLSAHRGNVRSRWPGRRDAMRLFALGLLGNGLYQICFIEGLARTRAGDAAIVIAASPAFIALIGRMRGSERVSARGIVGIVLSIAGIGFVVMSTGGEGAARQASIIGDLLILIGALCWSVYTVLLQPYTHRIGGLPLSALTMLGGVVPLAVFGAPSIATTHWAALPAITWGAVAYSALAALVVAYLFWYRGVRVIGPTRTAMYSNLQPLFAVAVAWMMLGEVPTLLQGIGAASILTGLVLTRS